MNCLIRPVTETDFEAVYQFINELEECVFPKESQRAIFLENLANSKHIFLLAEINQTPVGFLSCHVQNLIHHGGLVGEIQEMFVDANYRSHHIGKKLLDELKTIAKQNNLLQIEVTSGFKREKAHTFYEREGFPHTHKKFVWKCNR
ncbi:GNAT family N-acetyltransferase [Flavobacterium azooxidireducens]|uniref:GNAT family N-acetyltransferase n=1 Tax=Flavobacterium azooxidireducens TaxID=1871076 RepID=A0ABY4KE70_9FLAO|nr:GNAT family N-acetyltransferase [Flavobacterium azooxidireducens]UPQ79009.1 GNAT family N-acetyltransferase [Flavobacterium azooxidireducens]